MLILGHGWGEGELRLNSLASLRWAIEQGADGVELDVRLTRDGVLVLRHDAELPDGRLTNEADATEIDDATLSDALDACRGHTVNIEVKNFSIDPCFDPGEGITDAVIDLLESRGNRDLVVISSFGPGTTARVRERRPETATAHLLFYGGDPSSLLDDVVLAGHRRVHPYSPIVDASFMRAALDRSLEVNVWFNDDETPERVRELVELGVDGFITYQPAMVRDVASAVAGTAVGG